MYPSNLTVAIENQLLRQQVLDALKHSSANFAWTEQNPKEWAALLNHISSARPDVVLLDVESTNGQLGDAIRQVRSRAADTKVVAMHPEADPQSILVAMRAGAAEFVHPPFTDTLFTALRRIHESAQTDALGPKTGKLIAFLSAKGGCGSTTLACHIAAELQRVTAEDVLLADFDFTSGVVGFLMKASSSYSILDAVKNISRLDESLWKALITPSRPNFSILPAPASIAQGDYPNEVEFQHVLRFMRTQHDYTVIDLGRSLTRTARAVLDEVDDLFLVSTLEVMALHGLKAIVRGVSDSNAHKLHLVLNRTPKMMDITVEELEKILGRPMYATLPNDYPSLYHSYAGGTLLPANSRLSEHFTRFAGRIAGKEEPKPAKKRFSLFK